VNFFPQVSPPKPCIHLSSLPYVLHVLTISFFSVWSPEQYWVRSTDRHITLQFPISRSDLRFVFVFFGFSCMLLQLYGINEHKCGVTCRLHDIISNCLRNTPTGLLVLYKQENREKKLCKLCLYTQLV
jgi:hypothetical protein